METVNFLNRTYEVKRTSYESNDNLSLLFINPENKELGTVATVNLNIELPKNVAFIKDYSENIGVLKSLENANIIGKKYKTVKSGFEKITAYEINLDNIEEV